MFILHIKIAEFFTSVTLTPNLTFKKVGDSLSTVKKPQTAPTWATTVAKNGTEEKIFFQGTE